AQVIVNFGDRADGRTRILPGGFLRDGNGRAQPFDGVDVRLGHLPKELPRVAGKAFDVAALSFGVERVECQRTLPRPGNARQADQLIVGDSEFDALEVMFAGAANENIRSGHKRRVDPSNEARKTEANGAL